jgi:hypothetical protein
MDRGFPGQELKKLLRKIGIVASPNCACNKRAKFMDMQGIQWCEDNIDTIVDWLKEEAEKRRLPFVNIAAKILVKRAISNAKRKVKNMNNKIFIQIASYRDPELISTIEDILSKSKYPENLTFGICWQHSIEDKWDTLDKFKNDPRFRIIDVDWKDSKGLCWARSEIQKLWNNEDYTLQLDSHHRFLQNWDEELITMLKAVESEKPIITSYAGMYDPKTNKLLNEEPYQMIASNFTQSGTILFRPHHINNWQKLDKPIPARFVSGHFFFTIGQHCQEYKYDPNLYFAGDEISLSIRSYTLGYDLYHPHKTIVWHEYTREGRTKHWTDFNNHNIDNGLIDKTWYEMDNSSKLRLRHMLREEDNGIDLGEYGLGTVRTHREYELYAGISFKHKALHPDTLKGINPPINDKSNWWEILPEEYSYSLSIPVPNQLFNFIYIGIENAFGEVLYRTELKEHIPKLEVSIKSLTKPHKYVYWIYGKDNQWKDRIDLPL